MSGHVPHAVLYKVLKSYTWVKVELPYWTMTQVKVKSQQLQFYLSESYKVSDIKNTQVLKVKSIFRMRKKNDF